VQNHGVSTRDLSVRGLPRAPSHRRLRAKWVNEALDKVHAAEPAPPAVWNGQLFTRVHWQCTRTALRTGAENLTLTQRDLLKAVRCESRSSGGPGG